MRELAPSCSTPVHLNRRAFPHHGWLTNQVYLCNRRAFPASAVPDDTAEEDGVEDVEPQLLQARPSLLSTCTYMWHPDVLADRMMPLRARLRLASTWSKTLPPLRLRNRRAASSASSSETGARGGTAARSSRQPEVTGLQASRGCCSCRSSAVSPKSAYPRDRHVRAMSGLSISVSYS